MTNVLVYNVIDIDDLLLKVFVYIHDLHPVCSLISPRGHIFRNRNSDSCGQHLTTDELPASEEKLNTPFASVWDRERHLWTYTAIYMAAYTINHHPSLTRTDIGIGSTYIETQSRCIIGSSNRSNALRIERASPRGRIRDSRHISIDHKRCVYVLI